uniref:Bromo domain-containing protein n=1 Tax=Malurus cyaneus samueli TaxID=2593467 RepID=A0A8C5X006_9PASS
MQKTVPASQRAAPSPGRALSAISKPLLENSLERILQTLQRVFPHAEKVNKLLFSSNTISGNYTSLLFVARRYLQKKKKKKENTKVCFFIHHSVLNLFSSYCCRNPRDQPTSYRPRFILIEEPGSGQASDLAAAVIHSLEKFPIYTLDTPTLFASISPDETCVQVLMREAQRTAPSIIYVPQIPSWWDTVGPTVRSVFTTLLQNIPRFTPVLLLATSNAQLRDLPEEIKALFNNEYEEVFRIPRPTCAERRQFFEDLVMKQAAQPPAVKNNTTCRPLEVLPVAPPPKPRKLTEEEIKQVEEQEEDTLRELRIYLRDVTQRLVIDKRFRAFTKPVDPEEVSDIVKQPMDLSIVLSKIDMHQYLTARDFLKDIDLIRSNALKYNPNKGPADHLRHKACTLSDTAYSIVRHEMDQEFEKRCQKIKESRKERGKFFDAEDFKTCLILRLSAPLNASTPLKCKMKEDPSGITAKRKNVQVPFPQNGLVEEHKNVLQGQQKNEAESESESETLVLFLFLRGVTLFIKFYITRMERLYALLSQCIYRHREDNDKTELVKQELENFFKSHQTFFLTSMTQAII